MLRDDTSIRSLRYDHVALNPMGGDISMHVASACNRYACGNVVSRMRLASRPKPTPRPYPDVHHEPQRYQCKYQSHTAGLRDWPCVEHQEGSPAQTGSSSGSVFPC